MRGTITALAGILLFCGGSAAGGSFSTGGHTVYHLRPATVQSGQRAIVAAAYDGTVLCHTPEGDRLWQAETGGFFPFDLAVDDIDGDGLDEALVASGDGCLYAFDDNGRRLWVFEKVPPLFQVCTSRQADGTSIILTGGVEQVLYALSPQGAVLGTLRTDDCIRHVRAGNIRGEGRDYVAVATASRGLSGRLSLLLIDPAEMTVCWKRKNLGTHAHNSGKRFFSMAILDLDKDGRDDILLSNSWGEHGRIFAYDHRGEQMFTTTDRRIPNVSYRMNLLRRVKLPDDEFVLGHFGNVLIVYNLDGTCREVLTGPYSFADGVFDPVTKTWYMGSAVSGGDGIYSLRLDRADWRQTYANVRPVGRLAQIERNVKRLREQIGAFQPPAYQPDSRRVTVLGRKPDDREYRNLSFLSGLMLSQEFDSRDDLWCRAIDPRRRYDMSLDEIVAAARKMEDAGRDFVVYAGHGHAVHFPLSTFERILETASDHLWGFEFAEMEGVDSHMQEVVEKILLPVAQMCRQRGKHVIFRNKNIFWNGTCYVPFWKNVLLDSGYEDVFIPALEETNCRTQELSLAGRVGSWQAGGFNSWSCRMVTDNANFDRMWEWAGQQVVTHHLRHLISRASLGADVFFNSIHQGPFSADVYRQITPFYDMVEIGIIHIPARDELLSLSSVALGMRSPPSSEYINHGINGHNYRYPRDEHPPMVFDRLDCYWAGAPLLSHDFSRYAMRIDRRMCNYLPANPYGLVPIVPAETPAGGGLDRVFVTDGRYFYDGSDRRTAAEFQPVVESALQEASARLPVRVAGEVHWSVVRLDPKHVRVTLIDPGYLNPSDREAEIVLQHLDGIACVDILTNESQAIAGGRIKVGVPVGTLRILDVEHR